MISDVFWASAMILASRSRAAFSAGLASWAASGPARRTRQAAASAGRACGNNMRISQGVEGVASGRAYPGIVAGAGREATGNLLTVFSYGSRPDGAARRGPA